MCVVELPSPRVLQDAQVPIIGRTKCDNLLGPGVITNNMICAGFLEGGKDTCQVLYTQIFQISPHKIQSV